MKSQFLLLLIILVLASCNNDDSDTPPKASIESVVIDPEEVDFDGIGQQQQFTAIAYDEDGEEISTGFFWESTNTDVITVSPTGMAQTTGSGMAYIKASAGDKADSALVHVELAVDPSIWWVSKSGGDWSDGSNWSTGAVPTAEDSVAITLEGNYEVTLSSDVSIKHITLGSSSGIQKLATKSNQLSIEGGIIQGGASLEVDGNVMLGGELHWKAGNLMGAGTLEIDAAASFIADGDNEDMQIKITTDIINNGDLIIKDGARLLLDGASLENKSGAKIEFMGMQEVSLSAIYGGSIDNKGNIIKGYGSGTAFISPASADGFINTGYIGVENGVLHLRDGQLLGTLDISSGAIFSQSGQTLVKGLLNSRGDGVFEIGGNIILGEQSGDLVRLGNVILDSSISGGISGPGNLEINKSFIWYKGQISGAGNVVTDVGVKAHMKGSGSKVISERRLAILSELESESLLNLNLTEGAELDIVSSATWTHTGSGKINMITGDMPQVVINGTFIKDNPGSLEVGVDFICKHEMYLNEGILYISGNFDLQSSAKLTGGGADMEITSNYQKLRVQDANSAILAGTIEVDAQGEYGYLGILGNVSIEPTFKVLVDIDKTSEVVTERLIFSSGSIELAGVLHVNIVGNTIPDAGEYYVVSTINGTGKFNEIIGAEVFHSIKEDATGVVLVRQ